MIKGRILYVSADATDRQNAANLAADAAPDWEFKTASNEKEGLKLLDGADFAAAFADLSDTVAGAQFLHEVWKKQPRIVRFLLAAEADTDTLVTCAVGAHQFVQKPLEAENLKLALKRVERVKALLQNDRIKALVSRMRTLPGRPSVYLELLRELRSSNANAQAIGELISRDLAISTKLLQVVNSAFYGLSQHLENPADAVLLLGMDATASLVLSIEAFARFDKVKPLYFSTEQVWKHSQAVAQSARRIAEACSPDSTIAKDASTAGLLHDIGKLALALNFHEQYEGALKLAKKQNLPAWEVEKEVFGATHAEAGAYLLSLWGLPFNVVEAVAGHHLPASDVPGEFSALTALHLAERFEGEAEREAEGETIEDEPLNYPASLKLRGRIAKLRELATGRSSPKGEEEAEEGGDEEPITPEEVKEELVYLPSLAPENVPTSRSSARRREMVQLAGVGVLLALAAVYVLWPEAETPAAPAAARAPVAAAVQPEPTLTAAELAPYKLQAIMFNNQKSSVVINGRRLMAGGELDGVRVVGIHETGVTIQKEGRTGTLSLK